ncbi:hypothetical protein CHLRE_14g630775v5 [Chlamydomonas reinhardtii]|uniref:Uncharacterized protein n=1 Tax=Chlamydomonas reinhardtii TaxID=3055 RepID=A0A2K3CYN3_CHLRE|nr:uncharacterized protein CHLRE_14g630775v5 [Chlamydomonas reinhardtii]PNW73396.1 hypothetical protein CHLRE_14g630775v5 [Chlamydomonas reinhardtii]
MQPAVAASSAGLVAALARALTGHAQPPTAGADSSSVSTSSPSGPQQAAVAGGGEPVGATGKPGVSGFSPAANTARNTVQAGLQSAGNSVQGGLKGLTDAAEEHGSRTARGMGIAAGIGGIFALACVVVQWYLQSRGGGSAAGGRGDINAAIISRLLSAPQGYTVAEPEDLGGRLLATAAATGRPLQEPKTATADAITTAAAGQQQHASAQGAFNGGSGGNGGSGK